MALKDLVVNKPPREWRSEDDVIAAKRDNVQIGDFGMLADERHVFISHQRVGESPIGKVIVPRAVFEQMVEWWTTGKVPARDRRK